MLILKIVKSNFFSGIFLHLKFNEQLKNCLETDVYQNPSHNIWKTDRRFFVEYLKQKFNKKQFFFAIFGDLPVGELKISPEGQISSFTVLNEFTGQGIGKRLVKKAIEDKKKVFVIIEHPNGKKLFKKLGFKVYKKKTFTQWRMKLS